jgi:hypothetical protein
MLKFEFLYVSDGINLSALPHEEELASILEEHEFKVFA